MAQRKPEDCKSMDHVRVEIDRIDELLIDLVAARFAYVDRAWQLKNNPADATVPWRIRQVIDKVEARAKERGLPPELAVALWRQMIGWFIQYEEEQLAQRLGEAKDHGGKSAWGIVVLASSLSGRQFGQYQGRSA